MKQTLLTLLLFFALFGGQEAAAIPVPAGGVVQQEAAGIAQGELHDWPGALPELERLFTGQVPPATAHKQPGSPAFGTAAPDLEHWLQQGIARQVAIGQLCQASLSGIRIIFPFHYFW